MPATSIASPRTASLWQQYLKLVKFAGHCALCVLVVVTLPLHRRYLRQFSGWWYRRLLNILNIQVQVRGRLPEQTLLLISNHVSWLDIAVFGSLLQPAFVSKAEVANWPIMGAVARALGTIFLPRGAFKTQETSARVAATLEAGQTVVLFPESTTGAAAIPARFHARLFAPAIDHGHPVQPVAIRYLPPDPQQPGQHPVAPWVDDASLVGHIRKLLRLQGITVQITMCAGIDPAGKDRRSLAELSHSAITRALGQSGVL